MKKTLTIVIPLILLFLFPMTCWAQWGASMQQSTNDLNLGSTNESEQSSDATTNSSSDATTNSRSGTLMVAGAVIAVVGITITVRVEGAKKGLVLRLQNQIYLAEGKDYQEILSFFELEDRDLIKANDELVVAGYQIASDQDAADYLVALIRKLTERSQEIPYQVSVL